VEPVQELVATYPQEVACGVMVLSGWGVDRLAGVADVGVNILLT